MRHEPALGRTMAADALFAQICRMTPQEARDLSLLLTASERAALALFCNARTHMREHGRAIAGACSRDSLLKEGGHAGLVLFAQVEMGADTESATLRDGRRRVSLAG